MRSPEPYLEQVWRVLPRLLARYDDDPLSPTFGLGDRLRWAWRLIDFGNAKFQGAVNGLARLLAAGLLPDGMGGGAVLRRIEALFHGAELLRASDGSVAEAFPFEASFGLTGFLVNDLLTAVDLLDAHLSAETRRRYLGVVRPMVEFLHCSDETHGRISNHLAGAAAGLFKWEALTGEGGVARGRELLDMVLASQSSEGWFQEYGGADPGYQTFCTGYLAELHGLRPDLGLLEPLRRSVRFLWHFAQPDGSFGGLYGSRNTRLFAPGGVEALAEEIPEAGSLAEFMRRSIAHRTTVTLETMDAHNLVPMLNSYCWAAAQWAEGGGRRTSSDLVVPALADRPQRHIFPEAGLLVDRGEAHYTIVSLHKGGLCYHFRERAPARVDAGAVARDCQGRLYSTQAYRVDNGIRLDGDHLTVTAPFTALRHRLPTPFQFVLLRLLGLVLLRFAAPRAWVKRRLARLLFAPGRPSPARNRRTIRLGRDLIVEDQWEGGSAGLERWESPPVFAALRMASQGYWQVQDDAE